MQGIEIPLMKFVAALLLVGYAMTPDKQYRGAIVCKASSVIEDGLTRRTLDLKTYFRTENQCLLLHNVRSWKARYVISLGN